MKNLVDLNICEALQLLDKKEISSVELTKAHLDEMEKARFLNAYITETPELALQQAQGSDKKRLNGEKIGRLEGIPIANKDLYCTKGVRTTAASKILSNFVPPYESTVTQNLKDAGTVMLGKVNTDQFAMGGSTMTSYFGVTKNPWADENGEYNLVPGGSSGGSAAAVSAGLCMGADILSHPSTPVLCHWRLSPALYPALQKYQPHFYLCPAFCSTGQAVQNRLLFHHQPPAP